MTHPERPIDASAVAVFATALLFSLGSVAAWSLPLIAAVSQ